MAPAPPPAAWNVSVYPISQPVVFLYNTFSFYTRCCQPKDWTMNALYSVKPPLHRSA